MKPTRRSQPYRRGAATREPGATLSAMLMGRPLFGENPIELKRRRMRRAARRRY